MTTTAAPNRTLCDLREAAGLTQAEAAERISREAMRDGKPSGVSANTISRWERGVVTPGLFHQRHLARVYDVTVADLGLTAHRTPPDRTRHRPEVVLMDDVALLDDPRVTASRDEWRRTRAALNSHRPALTRLAAQLYPDAQVADTGLIAAPGWLPDTPVDLTAIDLTYVPDPAPPVIDGTEPASAHVRPCATLAHPYTRYTQAIRDLAHPRLFDNRVSWRLLNLDWDGGGRMAFGPTTYFAATDVCEALAHEMAYVHPDASGRANVRDLPLRRLVANPFDLGRRPVLPSINTLTIRGGDNPTFVLHNRAAGNVAVAGGTLHVMPCGVFQPSSVLPAAMDADFNLWRNMAREYSEEFLGNAEHGGDGQPADYTAEPLAALERARQAGTVRVHCLGVGMDALTLFAEILTVAVYDPDVYDRLFAEMVDANEEGSVVRAAGGVTALPFTAAVVDDILATGRMAPAGAGCLRLAWRHRDQILGG